MYFYRDLAWSSITIKPWMPSVNSQEITPTIHPGIYQRIFAGFLYRSPYSTTSMDYQRGSLGIPPGFPRGISTYISWYNCRNFFCNLLRKLFQIFTRTFFKNSFVDFFKILILNRNKLFFRVFNMNFYSDNLWNSFSIISWNSSWDFVMDKRQGIISNYFGFRTNRKLKRKHSQLR